jgi:hypothetical protein
MDASMSHFDLLHSQDIQQHPILLFKDDNMLSNWTDLGNADFPHLCASFEHSSPLLSSFSFPSVFSFERILDDDGSLSNEDLLSYAAFKGFNIVIKDNGKIRLFTSEFDIEQKLYVEPADYKVNAWSLTHLKTFQIQHITFSPVDAGSLIGMAKRSTSAAHIATLSCTLTAFPFLFQERRGSLSAAFVR